MSKLKALFFDQDGTIVDTERDGHRVAFNRAFEEFDLEVNWDIETYHRLLQIAGGKERMKAYLHSEGFGRPVSREEEDALIAALHKRKTDILVEMIKAGDLPLRPGVKRLMLEANAGDIIIGICTTSNEKTAQSIVDTMLKDVQIEFVLAGDVVHKKKPDPEIYRLALQRTGLKPSECLVVEDSKNGVDAARAASLSVLATTNIYTQNEDLTAADVIVTCLGDTDGEKAELRQGRLAPTFAGVVRILDLVELFEHDEIGR